MVSFIVVGILTNCCICCGEGGGARGGGWGLKPGSQFYSSDSPATSPLKIV